MQTPPADPIRGGRTLRLPVTHRSLILTASGAYSMTYTVNRRTRPAEAFTMISNAFLRDTTLSIAARGLGAYLLTHAVGFKLSASAVQKAAGTGRDKTRALLAELEQAGYLVRERVHERGRLRGVEYSMSDEKTRSEPSPENPSPVPPAETPEQPTENKALENKALAQPSHKKITSEKTTQENITPPGGDDFAAAPDGGMFPAPEKPAEEKPERAFSAATVVATYVDSYREKTGGDPTKRFIAQVGREAKALIAEGREPAKILTAATALGKTAYPTLERQFAILQHGGQASPARRTMPGPGVVHTREEIAQQERAFAEMPAATMLTPEEAEALMQELEMNS